MVGMNSNIQIEDEPDDIDAKESFKDIKIVDRDNEKLVNELNAKLKKKDDDYQKETEKLLGTIDKLKGGLFHNRTINEYSFNNLKIKNVFHTIYNNATNNKDNDSEENDNQIQIIGKIDKSINTELFDSYRITNIENSFSLLPICSKPVKHSKDSAYNFLLICLCIIFSFCIHFILEFI